MCSARPLDSGQRDELLCLAESDRTLKKTLDMMLFGVKRLDGRAADRPVSGFVRDALRRHPAFRTRSLVEALEHPDRSDDQHAIRILGALNYAALSWNEPSVRLSKNQVATCRANALRCLLLWYRDNLSSRLPLTRIHRHLRAELWEPTIARRTSEPERALALIKDRDPVATAIACTVSESQVAELRRQTQESRAAASRGELRAQQLETQCCDLERQLSDTRNRIAYLTDTLRTERTRHASEKAKGAALLRREVFALFMGLFARGCVSPVLISGGQQPSQHVPASFRRPAEPRNGTEYRRSVPLGRAPFWTFARRSGTVPWAGGQTCDGSDDRIPGT